MEREKNRKNFDSFVGTEYEVLYAIWCFWKSIFEQRKMILDEEKNSAFRGGI